jgi:trimeric autotransporter adhesin
MAFLLIAILSLGQHWQSPVAHAATFTVSSTADAPDAAPGDGICRANTFPPRCTLRAAIEEANSGINADTINLPAGTYTLTLGELVVTNAMTLNGAGATNTIVQAATSLSAAQNRVFRISSPDVPGEAPTVQINQVTIRHGNDRATSNNLDFTKGGGGIYAKNVLLFLQGTIVTDNEADHGAGIQMVGPSGKSQLSLVDAAVTRSRARLFHGGILCQHANGNDPKAAGPVELLRSRIDLNQSPSGPGGLSLRGCSLTMEQSTVALNRGGSHAGGIFAVLGGVWASLILRNVTISSNLLDASDPQGSANLGGAGGLMLSLNGGVANGGPHQQKVVLEHVTFAHNELRGNFEGAHNLAFRDATSAPPTPGTTLSLRNTIFMHSFASGTNCFFEDDQAIVTSLGGNVEFPGRACIPNPAPAGSAADLRDTHPRLGALANNGGPTQTHALTLPSPAVDLIPGSACLAVDQRGLPRPRDGNGDGVRRCDSGAFEVQ